MMYGRGDDMLLGKTFQFGPLRNRKEFWYEHVPICQDDPGCFRSACGYCHPERDARGVRWEWIYPVEWFQQQRAMESLIAQPKASKSNSDLGHAVMDAKSLRWDAEPFYKSESRESQESRESRSYDPWGYVPLHQRGSEQDFPLSMPFLDEEPLEPAAQVEARSEVPIPAPVAPSAPSPAPKSQNTKESIGKNQSTATESGTGTKLKKRIPKSRKFRLPKSKPSSEKANVTAVSQVGYVEIPKEEVSPIENLTTFTLRGGRAEEKVTNEPVQVLPQLDKACGNSDKAQLLDQPLPTPSPRSKGCWVIFYTWMCTMMLPFIRTIQEGAGEVPEAHKSAIKEK